MHTSKNGHYTGEEASLDISHTAFRMCKDEAKNWKLVDDSRLKSSIILWILSHFEFNDLVIAISYWLKIELLMN